MRGAVLAAMVFLPTIHVTVPSATSPAAFSISGASAETTTRNGCASGQAKPVRMRYISPWKSTWPSLPSALRMVTYSRMCRAGRS